MYDAAGAYSVASSAGAFCVSDTVVTFYVADDGEFIVADAASTVASVSSCASFILVFSTTPVDKLLPAASASLRTLGATGAALSAAARD